MERGTLLADMLVEMGCCSNIGTLVSFWLHFYLWMNFFGLLKVQIWTKLWINSEQIILCFRACFDI
jgi:hypothetical protein